jgi:hypothetical protein
MYTTTNLLRGEGVKESWRLALRNSVCVQMLAQLIKHLRKKKA